MLNRTEKTNITATAKYAVPMVIFAVILCNFNKRIKLPWSDG